MINLFGSSGNDLKSGKLSSGMGGRFHPESVAGLFRNGWQVWARIYTEVKTIREGCKNDYPMDEKRREKITFKLLISPPPYCDKVGITTDGYLKKFAAANCFFP